MALIATEPGRREAPSRADLAAWTAALGKHDRLRSALSDAERVDAISALEDLKAAAAAAQAVLTADFAASQRSQRAASGVRADKVGQGIGSQVALARRESPVKGNRLLGLAEALTHEMPHTLAALTAGRINEWRATLLVRETACLSREDRRRVDEELMSDPGRTAGCGDRALVREARRIAYRLDPEATVARARRAESQRRVTCRPAPDTMAYLTALLPVAQAVAVQAALTRAAAAARAAGDPRSRGQVMADTLVERVTGETRADDVGVEVQLVMTDRSLLGGGDEPAELTGHGAVPAGWARELVVRAAGRGRAWLRRLFAHPVPGELVAAESRRRTFDGQLAQLVRTRDAGGCRTPWCDAPVRHVDHVRPFGSGGATTMENGQGLCEQCNYVKEADGWTAAPLRAADGRPGGRHTVVVTTPTGHRYSSTAPPSPGAADSRSELVARLSAYVNAA